MADVFVERMVARRATGKIAAQKALLFVAAVLAALLPAFLAALVPGIINIMPLTVVGAGWGFFVISRRLNLEFEYIVTNGEMDVDKIMGKSTRKRLMTVDCRSFDILAPYKEEYRNEYNSQSIAKRVDVSSHPNSPGRWFAVFNAKDGLRTMLIFEPDERMLDAFRVYIRSKVKS